MRVRKFWGNLRTKKGEGNRKGAARSAAEKIRTKRGEAKDKEDTLGTDLIDYIIQFHVHFLVNST